MTEPLAVIVEDDAKLADIFSSAVQAAGFVTVVAENGRIALELLQSQTPVLIVLDLHLPDISGGEVLAFIQQTEHLQKAIVMLATADAWLAESLRADVDFVLMKPISFTQLRDLTGRLRPFTAT
ncbi:MAG: response regulator [Ardenticatenaceae bacterium]|nr:response regulator [Anaerolineales bacterium]MCB8980501.1 response regulator [Ardenticatenaceae bacterium]